MNPQDKENYVCVGTSDLIEAKRLRELMAKEKVEVEFRSNPETCSTGSCGVTVELWMAEQDIPVLQAQLANERAKILEGHEINPDSNAAVYDPSQSEVTCPACTTVFSSSKKECPDCGLVFME